MRVGVLGINHKLADLKFRELLAIACQKRFGAGKNAHGEHAFVLLSTCNRTEIYFSSDDLAETHTYLINILRQEVLINEDFDQKLYSFFRQDCFFHLCRVTAGLDSAIVAETEIQGQVKAAYESTAAYSLLPKELHYIFQKSLQIAKAVRTSLLHLRGMPDLEHAVWNAGMGVFDQISQKNVLFVGASTINLKILAFMQGKQMGKLTICNRTPGLAESVANGYQVMNLPWKELTRWVEYDWIIFGTKSPNYLISKKELNHQCVLSKKVIIDLCVPRNVDPELGKYFVLQNIDQLNRVLKVRKQHMNDSLIKAEHLVKDAVKRHSGLFEDKERYKLQLLETA